MNIFRTLLRTSAINLRLILPLLVRDTVVREPQLENHRLGTLMTIKVTFLTHKNLILGFGRCVDLSFIRNFSCTL